MGAGEIPAADHGSSAIIIGARGSLVPAVATLPTSRCPTLQPAADASIYLRAVRTRGLGKEFQLLAGILKSRPEVKNGSNHSHANVGWFNNMAMNLVHNTDAN